MKMNDQDFKKNRWAIFTRLLGIPVLTSYTSARTTTTEKLVPKQYSLSLSLSLCEKQWNVVLSNIVACVFLCSQPSGNLHTEIKNNNNKIKK
jgi:hypothetical protein